MCVCVCSVWSVVVVVVGTDEYYWKEAKELKKRREKKRALWSVTKSGEKQFTAPWEKHVKQSTTEKVKRVDCLSVWLPVIQLR